MTIKQIAVQLLRYIGVTSLDPTVDMNSLNAIGIAPGDLDAVAVAITAAIQRIFEKGPSALSEEPTGGFFFAPVTIACDVTQGSFALANVTGWQAWMNECTIRLPDGWDNRIRFYGGAYVLQRPYSGQTQAAAQGTVYCDALNLPPKFRNVIAPVSTDRFPKLHLCQGFDEFEQWSRRQGGDLNGDLVWGEYRDGGGFTMPNLRATGEPRCCYVQTVFDPSASVVPVYLRVNPMPVRNTPVTFTGKCKPATYTAANIDSGDHTTDPGITVPEEWNESTLLPFALKEWTSNPLFIGTDKQVSAIEAQYQSALASLKSWIPGIGRSQARYI